MKPVEFTATMRHFGHSPEAEAIAWEMYQRYPEKAIPIYKAIYNSLMKGN